MGFFSRFFPNLVPPRLFITEASLSFHVISFLIHTFIHSFIHPFIHSFIHSSIHSFIHPFIHSFIHPFIHSSIHSFHLLSSMSILKDETSDKRECLNRVVSSAHRRAILRTLSLLQSHPYGSYRSMISKDMNDMLESVFLT